MQCTSPIFCQPRTVRGGQTATGRMMSLPCGRCMACRLNKARMWSIRIMNEVKSHQNNIFLTLTYNPESMPKNGSLQVADLQKFFKRLRKNSGKKLRYFASGEYGDKKERPHYHAIIFGMGRNDRKVIETSWPFGLIHIGDVTYDSATYCASYTLKKLTGDKSAIYEQKKVSPEFSIMSRRPGIGDSYVATNSDFIRNNGFCIVKGRKAGLPRYYKDKIFVTDEEKKLRGELVAKFSAEMFEHNKIKAVATHGYQVLDYEKTQRKQAAIDLDVRSKLKRRKL